MSFESIDDKVIYKIKKAKRGSLFFVDDFIGFGSAKAVAKALARLVDKKDIQRVSRGIYARLEVHAEFGVVPPSMEDIAKAITKRDKAKIVASGVFALNLLGLSTQVPAKVVYLTTGSARKIQIGKRSILFKKAAPKSLGAIGEISGLVIQALKVLGKENLDKEREEKVLALLKKEDAYRLEHDIVFAPEWIRVIMRKAKEKNA